MLIKKTLPNMDSSEIYINMFNNNLSYLINKNDVSATSILTIGKYLLIGRSKL